MLTPHHLLPWAGLSAGAWASLLPEDGHEPCQHQVLCGSTPSEAFLVRAHPNQDSAQATQRATSSQLPPHPRQRAGSRQLIGLQALPTSESFSGTTQRWCPVVRCYCNSGLTQLKPKVTPDWPTNDSGTKSCPQQTKTAPVDACTEGKSSSATAAGHGQHTREIALKCWRRGSGGRGTSGDHRTTSSYSHCSQEQKMKLSLLTHRTHTELDTMRRQEYTPKERTEQNRTRRPR